jgi:hypothetical protein
MCWDQAIESDPLGPLLEETYGKEVASMLRWAHRVDWDLRVLKNIRKSRSRDPSVDFKLACLIYYNEDISQEERDRRWDSLEPNQTDQAIDYCEAWFKAPKQEGWRRKRKSHPFFPKKWKYAIRDTWEDKLDALKDLSSWTLERRRWAYDDYAQRRQSWESRLSEALAEFKMHEEDFGQMNERSLRMLI